VIGGAVNQQVVALAKPSKTGGSCQSAIVGDGTDTDTDRSADLAV
jgi:hypothetical protein